MRGRWLTPDSTPAGKACWRVVLPDSTEFLAAFKGAVDELRFSSNWEQLSGISADDAADLFATAFDTIRECNVIGEIIAYATTNPPAGTLACDGATYLRVDYPVLYAALASAFISDSDHFIVPDLRGRSIVGIGTGTGLTARAMNDDGGEENHQLSVGELASHNHTLSPYGHTALPITPGAAPVGVWSIGADPTTYSGSDEAHNTMHPFLSLGYAIVTGQ